MGNLRRGGVILQIDSCYRAARQRHHLSSVIISDKRNLCVLLLYPGDATKDLSSSIKTIYLARLDDYQLLRKWSWFCYFPHCDALF